jgi:hypothetical protein
MPIFVGRRTRKYVGQSNVPRDVGRRRKYVSEALRRMGTPMLHKPRFTDKDFKAGIVVKTPVYSDIYEQTRNRDPLSHGVGYMSVELSQNEWYDTTGDGTIVVSSSKPGNTYVRAPKYRGYGKGSITYIIEPDAAQDFYKATVGGPIFKVQTARAIAPWYPDIDDNDLLINIHMDRAGNITETFERFEAKNVSPISARGLDRRGRKEYGESFGNSHVLNQTFEMSRIPDTDVLYNVEVDR